jgi:hypothetical protein
MPSTATASPLAGISTAHLIAELLDRKARRLATAGKISAALGERNNFQLGDARLALEIAEAIAAETNLDSPFILVERNRHTYAIAPRKLLHWWLRTQAGWSFERIALHCERDSAAIQHSVTTVAAQLDFFLPVIERIRQRLELAKIAIA